MASTQMSKTGIVIDFLGISLVVGFVLSILPSFIIGGAVLALTSDAILAAWGFIACMLVGIASVLFCLYAAADYMAYEHAKYYG